MSSMFGKKERRFNIGLREETFAYFEAEAEELEMSISQYISWKLEDMAREVRDAKALAGEE